MKALNRIESVTMTQVWLLYYEDRATGRKWSVGPIKNKLTQGGLDNMAALLIGEQPSSTAAMYSGAASQQHLAVRVYDTRLIWCSHVVLSPGEISFTVERES